ncbi:MAG: hypothetical protein JW894_04480 [Bacteroidales bacterium]|nr:hypothetical protein [Bacteroidales bacterium]
MSKSTSNQNKEPNKTENISPYNKNRIIAFRVLSIIFSVILIVLAELLLRLFGYGYNLKLFTESNRDENCWEMSRYASYKYFTDEENITLGYIEPFKKQKEEDTYRIFVLGESTTIGFPYEHNGSFHRWLKYRLMFTFPEKNFEIINLSLTAVNSYTIYDFAREIVKYEPDAVLIYVGHNEYYGALGVGSTSNLGVNPVIVRSILKLRNLRLYQLLNNAIIKIRKKASDKDTEISEGLMISMPADKEIHYGSRKYKLGIEQFQNNMDKACKLISEKNIPVFFSNVVSNEKDLPPFISDTTNFMNSAYFQYTLASKMYKDGKYEKAKQFYIKAKELDMLRFRAPEAINDIILEISDKYPGVCYVDSKSLFEKNSPHGIIGNETLLEHVHPNLFGYAILSDAFYESMREHSLISNDWGTAMSFEELLDQMPVTIIDSMLGEYTISFMRNHWPFTSNPVPTESLIKKDTELEKITHELFFREITWNIAMDRLREIYISSGNFEENLKISEAFALEYPSIEQNYKSAAALCLRLNNRGKAIFYISKGFRLNPNFKAARQLSKLCLDEDDPFKAIEYLNYMSQNSGTGSNLSSIIMIVEEIITLKSKMINNQDNIDILNKIALNYLRVGNLISSKKYISAALKIDPGNKKAMQILYEINRISEEHKN